MTAIVRVHGLSSGFEFPSEVWLKSFDLDDTGRRAMEHGPDGELSLFGADGGRVTLTRRREHAHQFADVGAALAAWKASSKTTPLRPDGRPNRPLTAYTIEMETLP